MRQKPGPENEESTEMTCVFCVFEAYIELDDGRWVCIDCWEDRIA